MAKFISYYFCTYPKGKESRLPFSRWHYHEINGTKANGIADREKEATLTRANALELVNKWNGMTGNEIKYHIE